MKAKQNTGEMSKSRAKSAATIAFADGNAAFQGRESTAMMKMQEACFLALLA